MDSGTIGSKDTLHYLSDYGARNAVPLSRVDLPATEALNADRGLRFSPRRER